MKLIGSGSEIRKNWEKRGASEKVANEKRKVEASWGSSDLPWSEERFLCFPIFCFFQSVPFFLFLLQSFFLILGSTNLRRSYLSFSTHRLYDLISCACAVACIVLGPCNQLNPICQATAISSMASQIQWQQQSLSSQVELWWIIHPPKVPGDGMGI